MYAAYPVIGGLLTSGFSWRATFWFLVIIAGLAIASYLLFFRETFRKERSFAYQGALRRVTAEQARKYLKKADKALKDHNASNVSSKEKGDLAGLEPQSVPTEEVKLTLADVNILGSAWHVIRQPSNAVTLLATGKPILLSIRFALLNSDPGPTLIGLTFAFQYGVCYTAALTFAAPPYNYGPIIIGCILLSFGVGSVAGSIFGGRWSDRTLRRLQLQASQNPEGGARLSTPEVSSSPSSGLITWLSRSNTRGLDASTEHITCYAHFALQCCRVCLADALQSEYRWANCVPISGWVLHYVSWMLRSQLTRFV